MSSDKFLTPTGGLKRRAVHKNEDKLRTPKSSPLPVRKTYLDPNESGSENETELAYTHSNRPLAGADYTDSQEVHVDQSKLKVQQKYVRPSPKEIYPDLTVFKETTLVTTTTQVSQFVPSSPVQEPTYSASVRKQLFHGKLPLIFTVLLAFAVISGILFYHFRAPSKMQTEDLPAPHEIPYKEMQKTLITEMVNLKKRFPGQSKESWVTWLAAINTTLQERPEQPATLLLASTDGLTSNCLAKNLAAVVNAIFGDKQDVSVIDVAALVGKDTDAYKIKERLADDLNFALEQSHAVVLENVHELPPKAAMLLHGYCDNLVAPFKQRVIILTLQLGSHAQRKIAEVLHDLWTPELGVDTSSSIISRVANHAVVVENEKADGCTSINPF